MIIILLNRSSYLAELEEIRRQKISNQVSKYRKFSIILAVLIHIFAFFTGIVLLVVFSYPFTTMLIFHGIMQILAYLNNLFYTIKCYREIKKIFTSMKIIKTPSECSFNMDSKLHPKVVSLFSFIISAISTKI